MAEWSKALAWKVSIRQNRIEGSNPSRSAIRFNRLLPLIALGGGQVSLVRDFWSKLPSGGGPEYTAIFAEEPLDILYRHRLGEQEALDG